MTAPVSTHKQDLLTIVRAGIDAVTPARLFADMAASVLEQMLMSQPNHVVAVGKAAAAMAAAYLDHKPFNAQSMLVIGTHGRERLPSTAEWIESSHPYPDARSETAANRALAVAERVHSGEALIILLSGGASALMAAPIEGISLDEKIATTRLMMNSGADIHALNTVRRHLSKVKGGRLAAACVGTTFTLALSDVVGDDLNTIGSGPGVPDDSTWADTADALDRFGGEQHSPAVRFLVQRGKSGKVADTPKRNDPSMRRVRPVLIGSRFNAMQGARVVAEACGYTAIVEAEEVVGEARKAAPRWLERMMRTADNTAGSRRLCIISSGETTVTVKGQGIGGRNLEFALSLVEPLSQLPSMKQRSYSVASIGTDGIDGPSGVAGAIVDASTLQRAQGLGLDAPGSYLANNDSLAYFAPLDDAVRLGRTDTNVGDLQVLLID